ncbi:hypothetical protein Taro_008616 [Colocasia esculenta]|uniref:HMA domain-containing protein n=1 Tax=Colocasia esculenta TaxID=4460 RepID=A0A843TY41_COLES|nr:hypothetical protein [Colocasia esculenta]
MSKEEDIKFLKIQTCILKVNIHCDGCKQKVKKLLQKIDGVYTTTIDAEHGKVTVSGNVDPVTLIKKLGKAGKHAELLFPKSAGNNNQLINQLQKLQLDNGGKGGQKDAGKPQKGGGGGNNQKGQQPNSLEQLQQMKLFKDLNFAQLKDPKVQKSIKFMLPEEDEEGSDFDDEDDYDDEFDDEFDDLDGFDDDLEDDLKAIKAKAMAGGGLPLGNVMVNDKKGGGGGAGNNNNNNNAKKGGGGDANAQGKGADAKNGNGGGKKGGGGGGNQNQGGGGGGKNGGGGAQDGGKNGGNNKAAANGSKNNGNGGGGGGGGGGGKQAGGKGDAMPMSHQAMMAQMAANMNMPMGGAGQMRHVPAAAVQGLPAGGPPPGYYPGGAITPEMIATANPYQQQYIAAMMQQQRMMMNGQDRGFQPMAYARPPPTIGYMPPAPEYTHFFSDENTNSCTVM